MLADDYVVQKYVGVEGQAGREGCPGIRRPGGALDAGIGTARSVRALDRGRLIEGLEQCLT